MNTLYRIALDYDAELVEINPLVKTTSGEFIAADAKIIIDSTENSFLIMIGPPVMVFLSLFNHFFEEPGTSPVGRAPLPVNSSRTF